MCSSKLWDHAVLDWHQEGKIVETEECCPDSKRKYRGRVTYGLKQWTLGLTERRRKLMVILNVVKHDAATIFNLIQRYVASSDQWAAYRFLPALGYIKKQ